MGPGQRIMGCCDFFSVGIGTLGSVNNKIFAVVTALDERTRGLQIPLR